jgi:hypothetical protein
MAGRRALQAQRLDAARSRVLLSGRRGVSQDGESSAQMTSKPWVGSSQQHRGGDASRAPLRRRLMIAVYMTESMITRLSRIAGRTSSSRHCRHAVHRWEPRAGEMAPGMAVRRSVSRRRTGIEPAHRGSPGAPVLKTGRDTSPHSPPGSLHSRAWAGNNSLWVEGSFRDSDV